MNMSHKRYIPFRCGQLRRTSNIDADSTTWFPGVNVCRRPKFVVQIPADVRSMTCLEKYISADCESREAQRFNTHALPNVLNDICLSAMDILTDYL